MNICLLIYKIYYRRIKINLEYKLNNELYQYNTEICDGYIHIPSHVPK